jgi:hypothetical protein
MTKKELEDEIVNMIYSHPLNIKFNERLRMFIRIHVKAVQ